ncbi:hypothetical protein [Rhodoferax aquaticus]|nr:hypothetical protein [Rhodoferax aquaticus]
MSESTRLRVLMRRAYLWSWATMPYRPSNLIGSYLCAMPFEPLHGVEIHN